MPQSSDDTHEGPQRKLQALISQLDDRGVELHDRRRAKRFRFNEVAKFIPLGADLETPAGIPNQLKCLDISSDGIGLESWDEIETKYALLEIPQPGVTEPIRVRIEVMRCTPLGQLQFRYRVGCRFLRS